MLKRSKEIKITVERITKSVWGKIYAKKVHI
jgi:hypothetical protein